MLPQLLSLVLLVGLTAAGLLRAADYGPWRRLRAGGFGAGYGLSAALLLPVIGAYLRLGQLGVTAHTADPSFLFNAAPLYGRNLLGLAVPGPPACWRPSPWLCPAPPSAGPCLARAVGPSTNTSCTRYSDRFAEPQSPSENTI